MHSGHKFIYDPILWHTKTEKDRFQNLLKPFLTTLKVIWFEIFSSFPQYELAEILSYFAAYEITNWATAAPIFNIKMIGFLVTLFVFCINCNMSGLGMCMSIMVFTYVRFQNHIPVASGSIMIIPIFDMSFLRFEILKIVEEHQNHVVRI